MLVLLFLLIFLSSWDRTFAVSSITSASDEFISIKQHDRQLEVQLGNNNRPTYFEKDQRDNDFIASYNNRILQDLFSTRSLGDFESVNQFLRGVVFDLPNQTVEQNLGFRTLVLNLKVRTKALRDYFSNRGRPFLFLFFSHRLIFLSSFFGVSLEPTMYRYLYWQYCSNT